jgi:hypothetical protein
MFREEIDPMSAHDASRELEDTIPKLDDDRAKRVLAAIGLGLRPAEGTEVAWSPELGRALQAAFGAELDASPTPEGHVSEGDLAREALLVLAQDPQYREPVAALIRGPEPQKLGIVTTVVIIAGALIALQTKFKFKRNKDGTFEVLLEKGALPATVLKPLVEKLLALVKASGLGGV